MSTHKSDTKCNKRVANVSNIKNFTSTMSKLRRLKIQENLHLKSIKSGLSQDDLEDDQFMNNLFSTSTSKNIANTQNAFIEIRNLFQEVKMNASAPDADIEEIKKDIKDLEYKIKMQKLSLKSELDALKKSEQEISQQLDENHIYRNEEAERLEMKIKTFDDIVPSPVKNIIHSPMKFCEIQEFQDFVANHKRHGGWIEYHHNTFVRLWKKHLERLQDIKNREEIFETKHFQKFVKELLETIHGVTLDAILEHSQWYSTFITLKNRQQQVLSEWKKKKNIMKQTMLKPKNVQSTPTDVTASATKKTGNLKHRANVRSNSTEVLDTPDSCQSPTWDSSMETSSSSKSVSWNSSIKSNISSSGYLRSTKQWASKCFSYEEVDKWNQTNDLNAIGKLRVPSWRNTLAK